MVPAPNAPQTMPFAAILVKTLLEYQVPAVFVLGTTTSITVSPNRLTPVTLTVWAVVGEPVSVMPMIMPGAVGCAVALALPAVGTDVAAVRIVWGPAATLSGGAPRGEAPRRTPRPDSVYQ